MASSFPDRLWRVAFRIAYRLQCLAWLLFRPTVEGVYVAVWHGGRLLVIRNSYRRGRTLPGGRRRRAEPPASGAARELAEEAGIRVEPSALTPAAEFTFRNEHKLDHVHIFEFHAAAEPRVVVDRREVVSAEFLSPASILAEPHAAVLGRYLAGR